MAGDTHTPSGPAGWVRPLVWGITDTRVRATWRVLLAMPVLWVLTGGVLAGNVQAALRMSPFGQAVGGGLTQSLLHAGFFLIVLVAWARYLDRQPLSNYGISASLGWGRDFLLGVAAVLVGFAVWIGIGVLLGAKTVAVSPSVPQESVLVGLVVPFVALVLHAAVQQVVFFRVIVKNAAEGLHARGIDAARAAFGAIPVAVLFFVLMHGDMTPLRVLDLTVAGAIFALLYLHSGELAFGIGAHFGGFYAGIVVSALFQVTGSLSGVLGAVGQYGFPKMVVAYAVLVAWLTWRRGELPIQDRITQPPAT